MWELQQSTYDPGGQQKILQTSSKCYVHRLCYMLVSGRFLHFEIIM